MNAMNLIIYLIAGAIVGYVASRIMRTNSQQGLLLDIVVGVVGAFLAGYFISPLLGVGTINDAITIPTLLVTLLGSVVLLAIVNSSAEEASLSLKRLLGNGLSNQHSALRQ
jgi:uncharacterized membrane protein YeaQ/YmgE (transglycosylase-associated protein family)